MRPENLVPTKQSAARAAGSTTSWHLLIGHLSKIYVWLPASVALIAALAIGVYFLLASGTYQSPMPDQNDPSGIAADLPDQTSTEQDTPDKEADKKKDDKKSDKKDEDNKKGSKSDKSSSDSKGSQSPSQPSQPVSSTPSQPPVLPPPPSTPVGGSAKPSSSNTGPRYSITRSLTPEQALTELRRSGYLSRVQITGSLSLSGSDGRGWVIEDSRILTSGRYGIHAYTSMADFIGTQAERPIFRYVEVVGAAAWDGSSCSAVIYGSDIVIQHADLYGCSDIVKLKHRVSLQGSWLHDVDSPAGAHSDTMQIRSARGSLVQGNRFDAYVGYVSDGSSAPDGRTASGGLQTGSVTNDISVRFIHNWFAGGHYTIRGWASRDESYNIDYYFRDNIWMRRGTSVALGLTNLPPNRYGPVTGSLGDFDSSNVWEDTGQPVRN